MEMTHQQQHRPTLNDASTGAWNLADVIDFEILAHEDAEVEHDEAEKLCQRDRRIYKQLPWRVDSNNRRVLFHFWLKARRKERFHGRFAPGEEVLSLVNWCRRGLWLAGLLVAYGAVGHLLGDSEISGEPCNVNWFVLVCIAGPFLLSLCGFWVLLGQKVPSLPKFPAFFQAFLFDLIRPAIKKLAVQVSRQLGQEHCLNAQTVIGALKQRIGSRKSAISAMLFQLVQAFGVAFSIGVFVFTFLDCLFKSHAFSWQTTNQRITAVLVHRGLKAVALPWRYFLPEGKGFPSLRQVEQTQFVRFGDRSPFRDSNAASAWVSFLTSAAFVYGLVPRLILMWLSSRRVAAALKAETFEELRFDPLWERMTMERGSFSSPSSDIESAEAPPTVNIPPEVSTSKIVLDAILIPEEIHTSDRAKAIQEWLQTHKGWTSPTPFVLKADAMEKPILPADFESAVRGTDRQRILFVQESFMPPVQQTLNFLKSLRSELGPKSSILVGLLGKPDGTPFARPPKQIDAGVWRKKITGLGDSNLDVISFIKPD